MKKAVLLTILVSTVLAGFSQSEGEYMQVMVKQQNVFKMAHSIEDFQNLANSYERIANAETDKWHLFRPGSAIY